jgi:hypothetical protein
MGRGIGLTTVLLWWFEQSFNPFGLPTSEHAPANYPQPVASVVFDKVIFVLCPAALLQVFPIGIGGWVSWVI